MVRQERSRDIYVLLGIGVVFVCAIIFALVMIWVVDID